MGFLVAATSMIRSSRAVRFKTASRPAVELTNCSRAIGITFSGYVSGASVFPLLARANAGRCLRQPAGLRVAAACGFELLVPNRCLLLATMFSGTHIRGKRPV